MEPGKGNCATCAGLIRLCSGLDFFSADAEVRRLLVERLHRLAKDHQHARAMIDHWLDTQTVAPKVADLVTLASRVRSGSDALPAGCEICNGEYWVIGERGADRCTCPRGQALRQMEQRRALEPQGELATWGRAVKRRTTAGDAIASPAVPRTQSHETVSNGKGDLLTYATARDSTGVERQLWLHRLVDGHRQRRPAAAYLRAPE